MLGALIIVFREVIEAGLIVGIVMAATRGVAGRGRWITIGVVAGVLGAAMVAAVRRRHLAGLRGRRPGAVQCQRAVIAVVMLMWHNAWMARHGREIAAEMRQVGAAVSEGARPLTALAIVVGLAVLREGSEVVLFLYGIAASGTSGSALLVGGLLGIAAGAAFTALTYFGLLAIPTRYIFSVTSWLIALLAAGMAAQAVQFLNNAGGGRARPHHVGHLLAALGRQHLRPAAAHADRLHRAADRIAADGLSRHAVRDVPADADRALLAATRAVAGLAAE